MQADAVKLVVVRNEQPNEDHAAVAARLDDQWLILDDRRLAMVRDVDLAQATPELELDERGARRFVRSRKTHPVDLLSEQTFSTQ